MPNKEDFRMHREAPAQHSDVKEGLQRMLGQAPLADLGVLVIAGADRKDVAEHMCAWVVQNGGAVQSTEPRPGNDLDEHRQKTVANAHLIIAICSPELTKDAEALALLEHASREAATGLLGLVPVYLHGDETSVPSFLRNREPMTWAPGSVPTRNDLQALVFAANGASTRRRQLQRQLEEDEARKAVDDKAREYIKESIADLQRRENRERLVGYAWYVVGWIALAAGVSFAVYRFLSPPSIRDRGWQDFAEFAVLGAVAVGLLVALSKYAFTLGKGHTVEGLRYADRLHAIRLGELYLAGFATKREWSEAKDVFQSWNLDRTSSFASQSSGDYDPKLLELTLETLKTALSAKK